jgi:CheY-like chemotaxis protein
MEGHGKRILLVDDNEDIRCLLSDLFTQEGYTVNEAADGRQALVEMKRGRYDVVLCDYHMPNMNGLTFLEVSRLVWPDTPVIMASCDTGLFEQQAKQPLASAFAVLSKPFDLDRLLSIVDDAAHQSVLSRLEQVANR